MNKKEIENKIEALEKQLEELKKEANSIEDEKIKKGVRQMPETYESYYYVSNDGNLKMIYSALTQATALKLNKKP